ncbi:MAG: TIM barrel protein [Caulobacteraceae bacterium]
MILFGPSGNSDSFYEQGYKSSLDMPGWLRAMNLDAYEYSCARGMRINADIAEMLGERARENGIALSVHAPYYINLASGENKTIENSETYIFDTAEAAEKLGAKRIVLHPGSSSKISRKTAFENVKKNLYKILEQWKDKKISAVLCPETMGKKNQIGTLEEVLELCLMDDALIPTLDFGHLHALNCGALKEKDDYRRIFYSLLNTLGNKRGKTIHIHYSRIEYTEKGGEKKHWCYDDTQYGPEFEPLAECLEEYGVSATIICESRGTMAEDALKIKNIYNRIRDEHLLKLENL